MKLRVKFSKHGALRFIGHLDVMRFFQKAIRRAEIDIAYTGGYSPHQVMSFAHPLGVGLESDGEYMDIEVNSISSVEDIRERLNAASVPEIQVRSVVMLPDKAPNAMASVAAAEYVVSFRDGRAPRADLEEAVRELLARDEVLITKEGKAGPRQVDIRPGIYTLECFRYSDQTDESGITDAEPFGCGAGLPDAVRRALSDSFRETVKAPVHLHLLVDASSAGNIKPIQVAEAMLDFYGEALMENALLITRLETYGRDAEGTLQPLEAFGQGDAKSLSAT